MSESTITKGDTERLPRWMTSTGWICVASSALLTLRLAWDLVHVPPNLKSGVINYSFPAPTALAMLAWEFAHPLGFVVFISVLRLSLKRVRASWWNWALVGGLLSGFVTVRLLLWRLAAHGVSVAMPGFIH